MARGLFGVNTMGIPQLRRAVALRGNVWLPLRQRVPGSFVFAVFAVLLLPSAAWAAPALQETPPQSLLWSYLAGGLAYLVPLALVLLVISGLEAEDARAAAYLIPATVAVTALAYVAVGFALEFGGVGLMDSRHGFSLLVWEWSALPEQYGPYWGMAGFAGWLLMGGAGTPEAVALFFGHLPWVLTAALIPVLAVRQRTAPLFPLILAALTGGLLAPVAGNWVHGGGWLARLGMTLGWGHGYVDVAGSAQVGLVGGGVGLAALLAFRLRRDEAPRGELPPVHLPVLGAVGVFLLFIGTAGWSLNNPLYDVNSLPLHRILTNAVLGIAGGAALPALYTWFVAGRAHPHMVMTGAFAGWLSVLAGLPFLSAVAALGVAMGVGVLTPLAVYLVREVAALDDPAGIVTASLLGGVVGPLTVAGFADGRYGEGWHGIAGPIASWLNGMGSWEAQMQAQLVGAGAQFLWAFLLGSVVCVALAVLWWAAGQVGRAVGEGTPPQEGTEMGVRQDEEPVVESAEATVETDNHG